MKRDDFLPPASVLGEGGVLLPPDGDVDPDDSRLLRSKDFRSDNIFMR